MSMLPGIPQRTALFAGTIFHGAECQLYRYALDTAHTRFHGDNAREVESRLREQAAEFGLVLTVFVAGGRAHAAMPFTCESRVGLAGHDKLVGVSHGVACFRYQFHRLKTCLISVQVGKNCAINAHTTAR